MAKASPPAGLYLGTAISGAVQWSTNPATARIEVEAMRRFGVLNQPHFLETAQELELQRSKWSLYRDAGAFGPRLIFGHFVQATSEMIEEAGRCGCGMVWQPTSNGRLASGFANIRACVDAGHAGRRRPRRPILHRHFRSLAEHALRHLYAARQRQGPRRDGGRRDVAAAYARLRRSAWASPIASAAWRSANTRIF